MATLSDLLEKVRTARAAHAEALDEAVQYRKCGGRDAGLLSRLQDTATLRAGDLMDAYDVLFRWLEDGELSKTVQPGKGGRKHGNKKR